MRILISVLSLMLVTSVASAGTSNCVSEFHSKLSEIVHTRDRAHLKSGKCWATAVANQKTQDLSAISNACPNEQYAAIMEIKSMRDDLERMCRMSCKAELAPLGACVPGQDVEYYLKKVH